MTAAWMRTGSVSESARADVNTFMASALATVLADLTTGASSVWQDLPSGCERFLRATFMGAATAQFTTVRELATFLRVLPSTLMSRFFRAGLPAPKRYLAWARLLAVARLLEDPYLGGPATARTFRYSSPQALTRHTRLMLGMTVTRFRETYNGMGLFEQFRTNLIFPYREILRTFDPLPMPSGRHDIRDDAHSSPDERGGTSNEED